MDFSKHIDKFSATVNGVKFGAITDYSISYVEKKYPAGTDTTDLPKMHYVIKLTRRLDAGGLWQTLKFYDSEKFKVVLQRDGTTTTFEGFELISLSEHLGTDRLIYQTMEFSGTNRKA